MLDGAGWTARPLIPPHGLSMQQQITNNRVGTMEVVTFMTAFAITVMLLVLRDAW
jgi:hypothetical protein